LTQGHRNLIVGCDGTWNEPDTFSNGKPVPTNVVRMLRALVPAGGRQHWHYEQGVGTRPWEALAGGIYGYGLSKRVQGAYRWLRSRFGDKQWQRHQNRVFLFGFSRGAYTVRRLAGLLAMCGLPLKSRDSNLAWEIFLQGDWQSAAALKREGRFFDVAVEMVGCWDTVKATNDRDFHDHVLSPNVVAGYHAMAIDERRRFFPVLRWNRDKRVLQMWFAGVHSDVGGGYENHGLSDVALKWMILRGLDHGLKFSKAWLKTHVKDRPLAAMHESNKGIWAVFGTRSRIIRKSDWVHQAVRRRLKGERSPYRPANLRHRPVRYWPPN
jgi:uncharacterized protein (DUF2235 family)